MQDSFSHAIYVFLALMFTLPHIYICYDFAPSSFDIEFCQFLLVDSFFPDVFSCSFDFLLLLSGIIVIELSPSFNSAGCFLLPFTFLYQKISTLFYLRVFWILSSYSRMRFVVSSSSKSLKSFSPSGSAANPPTCWLT